jgi:hypothetical protein
MQTALLSDDPMPWKLTLSARKAPILFEKIWKSGPRLKRRLQSGGKDSQLYRPAGKWRALVGRITRRRTTMAEVPQQAAVFPVTGR